LEGRRSFFCVSSGAKLKGNPKVDVSRLLNRVDQGKVIRFVEPIRKMKSNA
jgi:hypothetical protein